MYTPVTWQQLSRKQYNSHRWETSKQETTTAIAM
jgi:hypothetical protein